MSTTTTTTVVETPITAETILRLFPDIDTTSTSELDGHDEEQIRLMDEVCIVLDENDEAIGTASKKICTSRPRPSCVQEAWLTDHRVARRPSDDQHRQGSPPPRLLRLPLQR